MRAGLAALLIALAATAQAAPMEESNRSTSPFWEHTFKSANIVIHAFFTLPAASASATPFSSFLPKNFSFSSGISTVTAVS